MDRLTRILIAFTCATLLGGCARSPETDRPDREPHLALEVDPAEVRAAVDRGNTNYMDALLSGNAKLFSECFTENGAMLLPGGRVLQSRDSIFTSMRPAFQATRVFEGKVTTDELYILDENAFEIGHWSASVGPIAEKSAPADSGQYVRIWKRDDKREWKIWRDIVRRWRLGIS